MSEAPRTTREIWRGLQCTRLTLSNGDSAVVADFGAQVLSWEARGLERLFLSPRAVLDGSAAIRGGIPVCFPQFNNRGPLPKHGLARLSTWDWSGDSEVKGESPLEALWLWQPATPLHPAFAHALRASLSVQLTPGALRVNLAAHNTGDTALAFTGALHTYLAVHDAAQCQLTGLDGAAFWDAANGFSPAVQKGSVTLGLEVDRVYGRSAKQLTLADGVSSLQLGQDHDWTETVVWNPGADLCMQLADMESDSWQQMLCVEAARINQPQALLPGACWQASQQLTVIS